MMRITQCTRLTAASLAAPMVVANPKRRPVTEVRSAPTATDAPVTGLQTLGSDHIRAAGMVVTPLALVGDPIVGRVIDDGHATTW